MRLKTTPMTVCLCVIALLRVRAQIDRAPSRSGELAVFAGVVQSEQLNATASPLTFRGRGLDVAADYRRALRGDRLELTASLDGGVRTATTAEPVTAATEHVSNGDLTVALLRQFARDSSARSFGLGIAGSADLSMTAHRYADPTRSVAYFLAAFVTLGPAASWREPIAGGVARLQVSTPLIALADHPYSEVRSDDAPTTLRFASAGSLRGVSGVLSYAPAERRQLGIVYAYRFAVVDYADVQPLRTASQSLAIGVVRRFGGAPK